MIDLFFVIFVFLRFFKLNATLQIDTPMDIVSRASQLNCKIVRPLILSGLNWTFLNGKVMCQRLATYPLIKPEIHEKIRVGGGKGKDQASGQGIRILNAIFHNLEV